MIRNKELIEGRHEKNDKEQRNMHRVSWIRNEPAADIRTSRYKRSVFIFINPWPNKSEMHSTNLTNLREYMNWFNRSEGILTNLPEKINCLNRSEGALTNYS
jgi:hypothetical protein